MMEKLTERGEEIARAAQARQVRRIADQLSSRFGRGAVESDQDQVLVSARGLVKRWLVDPSLRFLAGDMT